LKWLSIIFGVGSLICLCATNLNILIFGRIIQGIGGGPFMPLSQAILLQVYPKEKHGVAMGVFSIAVMVSAIMGPAIGGYLVDNFCWQALFIINIPISIFSVVLIHCNIMNNPNRVKVKRPDVVGIVALILWLLSMQVVLDKGQQYGWFDARWICWLSGFSAVMFTFFVVWEIEHKNPIANLRVFKNLNFVIGTVLASFVNMAAYSTLSALPMFLQSLMGYTAQLSGATMLARSLSCFLAIIIVSKLVSYIDSRIMIALGFFMLGVSTLMLTNISLEYSFICTILPNIIFGFGLIMAFIPISSIALSTLPKTDLASGAGMHSLSKCVATSVTISMTNTLVARLSQAHQVYLVGNMSQYNNIFRYKLSMLTAKFLHFSAYPIAQVKANVVLYKQLLVQSKLMAFVDVFAIFALPAFILMFGVFFFKTKKDT
jgi:DHA2 family multidrug resistance protein